MKLTLLGTGSAEGMPGLFCRCATCERVRVAGGKNIRTRSSALIDDCLKIDFPPDIFSQCVLRNVDLTRIEAVLFTHGHDDHFCGSQLQYRGIYFVVPPVTSPLQVYGPADVIGELSTMFDPGLVSLGLHVVKPGEPSDVAGYQVIPFVSNHDARILCLNYIIRATDGTTLLYASDTGWYPDETWRMLEAVRFDGVLVECGKRLEGGYPGHLSIPEVIRMRRRFEASGSLAADAPMVTTHFSHTMEMLHEDLEAALAPHGITAGYDGITVNVTPN